MGKTAKGAVWLDPDKTSPYDFYQYWRNIGDADVLKCLRMMTFLPLEQIDEMDHWEGAQLNEAKKILAHELTTLVHGEEEAKKAEAGAQALFGGAGDAAMIPEVSVSENDLKEDAMDIVSILVAAGLCPTRSEARRAVEQGGVSVDDVKVPDIKTSFGREALNAGILVRRGKKNFKRVKLS